MNLRIFKFNAKEMASLPETETYSHGSKPSVLSLLFRDSGRIQFQTIVVTQKYGKKIMTSLYASSKLCGWFIYEFSEGITRISMAKWYRRYQL